MMASRFIILTFGTVVMASTQNVVKRSDDTDTLEAVVSRLAQDVATLNAKVQTLENYSARTAAFHGIQLVHPDNVVSQSPIQFSVASQVGGGYDSTTGVYTAPYSGWYIFHARLNLKPPATFNLNMMQNDHLVGKYLCVTSQQLCAYSMTLHVNAGDRLWIEPSSYHGACWNAPFDNLFSAVLVEADLV